VVIRPIPWYSTQTFGSDCEETRCDDTKVTKLLAAHGWTAMELRWAARGARSCLRTLVALAVQQLQARPRLKPQRAGCEARLW
jgi:hypothetical protein